MNYESVSPSVFISLTDEIISKHVLLLRSLPTNEEIKSWDLDRSDLADFINIIGHFNKQIKNLNQKSIEYLDTIKH